MNYIKMTPQQNAEKLRKHWEKVAVERKDGELKKVKNIKFNARVRMFYLK